MKKWVVWTLLFLTVLIVLVIIFYPKYEHNGETSGGGLLGNDSQQKLLNNSGSNNDDNSNNLGKYPYFDIYYSFGVGEANIIDTNNDLYIKDMICIPDKNYTIFLNDGEKDLINESLYENDFLI